MNLITLQTEWVDSQAYQTEASWQQSTPTPTKIPKINELCTALAAITVQLRTNSSSSGGHGYGGRGMETETMEVNEDIGDRGWGSPNGCGNRGGQRQRGIVGEKSDQDRHHTGWKSDQDLHLTRPEDDHMAKSYNNKNYCYTHGFDVVGVNDEDERC